MDRTGERYRQYCAILQEELVCAFGCTEPIAIAYAAARARDLLGGLPDTADVRASGSIIKNAKSVVVPGTGGLKGIEAAVAAGFAAGDAARGLEVIAGVDDAGRASMRDFLDTVPICVDVADEGVDFDLWMRAFRGSSQALVRIADYHTNIVHEELDGRVLRDVPVAGDGGTAEGLTDRTVLNMADIWDFAMSVCIDDVRGVLDRQIACNTAISQEGVDGSWGANVGSVMLGSYGDDVKVRACAKAAAASDARMSGCELPVVINSGSGNQGITVSVPLVEYARELGSTDEQLYRALVLSNLCAIHQRAGIGRLSAFCGAVCAGAAAGAGIAYLDGGGYREAVHAVVNALSITSGMVCDGAKPSCAAKIAFSVNAGILGYAMIRDGQQFLGGDGIVKKGVENTIESIVRLGRDGMRATNDEIIRIMLG